jgi:hypothetical protein
MQVTDPTTANKEHAMNYDRRDFLKLAEAAVSCSPPA